MKSGIELITEERNRQIFDLGYTVGTDKERDSNELVLYAIGHIFREIFIFPDEIEFQNTERRCEHIKNLTQAGALIAAEIDRLQTEKD